MKLHKYHDAAVALQEAQNHGDRSPEAQRLLALALTLHADDLCRAGQHADGTSTYEVSKSDVCQRIVTKLNFDLVGEFITASDGIGIC